MERDEKTSRIEKLAKEVFGINQFFGKITYGDNSLFVWSRGLIPRVIAQIVPGNEVGWLFYRGHERKAEEFERRYKEMFHPSQYFRFRMSYD